MCVLEVNYQVLCIGRDRSLQCSRSSLKRGTSAETVQFCDEHAPSGSADLPESQRSQFYDTHALSCSTDLPQSQRSQFCDTHASSGSTDLPESQRSQAALDSSNLVAEFFHSQSSVDETDSISSDFDGTDVSRIYLLILDQSTDRDKARLLIASLYKLLHGGLESCRTPGCEDAARHSGYCFSCVRKLTDGRSLAAIECSTDHMASADDGDAVPCSKIGGKLSAEEVEASPSLETGEITGDDNAESASSRHVVAAEMTHPHSVTETMHKDPGLCRGPYCGNAGLKERKGLCEACYYTLLKANTVNCSLRHDRSSSEDIGAGLD